MFRHEAPTETTRLSRASTHRTAREVICDVMFISEILGTLDDGRLELCATAEGAYDSTGSRISVTLEAFLRRAAASGENERIRPMWIPGTERVTEHVPREEADEFLKDVFHSWASRVRHAVPREQKLRT